jgi:hypothetical protein
MLVPHGLDRDAKFNFTNLEAFAMAGVQHLDHVALSGGDCLCSLH